MSSDLNQQAWDFLSQLYVNQRWPHALLLITDTNVCHNKLVKDALLLLLCKDKESFCGSCIDCHLTEQNSHPDLILIKPEKENGVIKIDQIRDLQHRCSVFPQRANYNVVLIEAADRMNLAAANALLKILEEPPSQTIFILRAESLNTLPPTVLSRCHIYKCPSSSVVGNVLSKLVDIDPDSSLGNVCADAETILNALIAIIEKKSHPCTIAQNWSTYNLKDLLWFLYLVYAQIQTMLNNNEVSKLIYEGQLRCLAKLLKPSVIFAQLDKINAIRRKLNANINANQLLVLEDLLFDL